MLNDLGVTKSWYCTITALLYDSQIMWSPFNFSSVSLTQYYELTQSNSYCVCNYMVSLYHDVYFSFNFEHKDILVALAHAMNVDTDAHGVNNVLGT